MDEKVIIFDFDGVLADTLGIILNMGKQVSARLGYPFTPSSEDLNALEMMSFAEYGRQLGIPEQSIQAFVEGCVELFTQMDQAPPIFPGMAELVRQLAATSKLGIVTGSPESTVRKFLKEHGLEGAIDVILGISFPGARAEKVREAIHRLGGEGDTPADMVGDSISDIRAARAVGITAIAVGWGHQSPERLAAEKPDYLVKTPAELMGLLCEGC